MALASVLVLLATSSSAKPLVSLRGDAVRQIDILKAAARNLRIPGSALVHEEGGEFLSYVSLGSSLHQGLGSTQPR